MTAVDTLKFGRIEVVPEQIYSFPEGMIGFPSMTRYVLMKDEKWAPFMYLQSRDLSTLAFVVADSSVFFPNYSFNVTRGDIGFLSLESGEEPKIWVILTLYKQIDLTTANLKGPLVVNDRLRIGRQLILLDNKYSTKERIFNFKEVENVGVDTGD